MIAVPTDTIYGVAALVQLNNSVESLYEIKGRHREKPIAICVAEISDIFRYYYSFYLPAIIVAQNVKPLIAVCYTKGEGIFAL